MGHHNSLYRVSRPAFTSLPATLQIIVQFPIPNALAP